MLVLISIIIIISVMCIFGFNFAILRRRAEIVCPQSSNTFLKNSLTLKRFPGRAEMFVQKIRKYEKKHLKNEAKTFLSWPHSFYMPVCKHLKALLSCES